MWSDTDYRNWRRRTYGPAAVAIGETGPPYDLRHSFASLLIHEGRTAVEVAAQLADSAEVLLGVYAHVFAEIGPATTFRAADAIEAARAEFGVREMYAELGLLGGEDSRDPASVQEADAGTRTADPIITVDAQEGSEPSEVPGSPIVEPEIGDHGTTQAGEGPSRSQTRARCVLVSLSLPGGALLPRMLVVSRRPPGW